MISKQKQQFPQLKKNWNQHLDKHLKKRRISNLFLIIHSLWINKLSVAFLWTEPAPPHLLSSTSNKHSTHTTLFKIKAAILRATETRRCVTLLTRQQILSLLIFGLQRRRMKRDTSGLSGETNKQKKRSSDASWCLRALAVEVAVRSGPRLIYSE